MKENLFRVKLFIQIITTFQGMKFQESLLTETTKQSLIQVPSAYIPTQQSVKVFTQFGNRTFSITLPLLSKTIQSLIRESLQQFKAMYGLEMEITPEDYSIYAARRNGNKCRDYPSLDNSQNILLTNVKTYFLIKKSQKIKDVTYPLSQITMERQKKQEKKVKKNPACFCIF